MVSQGVDTDQIHLLLIDDDPALLRIGKLFLEKSGDFSVSTTPGAEEAIHQLAEDHFDAIISDLNSVNLITRRQILHF